MTFESAIRDGNPENLATHILNGSDVIYFTSEDTLGRVATLAAVADGEKGERRPATEIRNEAMRLYTHGLCDLVQRRTEREISHTRIVTVDYIAVSKRKAA